MLYKIGFPLQQSKRVAHAQPQKRNGTQNQQALVSIPILHDNMH